MLNDHRQQNKPSHVFSTAMYIDPVVWVLIVFITVELFVDIDNLI